MHQIIQIEGYYLCDNHGSYANQYQVKFNPEPEEFSAATGGRSRNFGQGAMHVLLY